MSAGCRAVLLLMGSAAAAGAAAAAAPAGSAALPAGAPSAHLQAPFDPTGYWVSIITEDWRFRMVVPGKGEYDGIPISLAAKQFADAWSPATDEAAGRQCKAYGAGAIMRVPGRLHITWQNDDTLRVDTDAGMQTRLLRFVPSPADTAAAPSLQGFSVAKWFIHPTGFVDSDPALRGPGVSPPPGPAPSPARAPGPRYGWLKVTTDHLLPGYLRKNGVPYSGQATMVEYWEQHTAPGGAQWLIVSTTLDDPRYLQSPYVFSPNFRKEPDGSKWDPAACSLRW
ncbi:MAG TPA: hypothetical protein VHX52_04460 [Steroidobacteraceae bacterium]|jgi:hypothetical protein|nr:hypothetical protein [Steroidobacteraceae bacterium]